MVFDDDVEQIEEDSMDSLGSAINMQTLNTLTLERVNIAEKKLLKGIDGSGRKMSFQFDSDYLDSDQL
jgi:hypothetical protein